MPYDHAGLVVVAAREVQVSPALSVIVREVPSKPVSVSSIANPIATRRLLLFGVNEADVYAPVPNVSALLDAIREVLVGIS